MPKIVRQIRAGTPGRNRGGRLQHEDNPADALRMQRMLMQLRRALPQPSMLTGKRLTTRGLVCWIYWQDQRYPTSMGGSRLHAAPEPPLGSRDALLAMREQAEGDVRHVVS